MAYRIIALDLDGTLLNAKKELSDVNRQALAQAAQRGVEIVPTTGRFFGMMPACVRDLDFVHYAITINGAQVYDRVHDCALVKNEIPLVRACEVMAFLDDYDVIYDCYRNNWGWMTQAFKDKAQAYATNEQYYAMIQQFRKGVGELKQHLAETSVEGDVQKMMLFSHLDAPRDQHDALAKALSVHFPDLTITATTRNNLEINAKTAHKGAALAHFAESLGYTLAECMAFGDGTNDLSMIQAAGMGVAMANAFPTVLQAADYVTSSNDDDGVAAALRHFALVP